MDSLTQIVLGAAVGEAVLGKKVGNKAVLYGAIAGTIPDLDVLLSSFVDTTTALSIHRGFTHSIAFSIIFAPIFAWLVSRYEKYKNMKGWTWLFFLAFVTHPILDAQTTWGTQLFWPFDIRIAFDNIFIIDPFYTLPFLICLVLAMLHNRKAPKRLYYNKLGLQISTSYLILSILLKGFVYTKFEESLDAQNISYTDINTRPSPMNIILWSANIKTENAYLMGHYSLFDSQPVAFDTYPKNHQLLGKLIENEEIQRMVKFSKGWYIISKENDELYFNDLRSGTFSFTPKSQDFVFKYKILNDKDGQVQVTEAVKVKRDSRKILNEILTRARGN